MDNTKSLTRETVDLFLMNAERDLEEGSKVLALDYSEETPSMKCEKFLLQSVPSSEFLILSRLCKSIINQIICERYEYKNYYIVLKDLGPNLENIGYYNSLEDSINVLICV